MTLFRFLLWKAFPHRSRWRWRRGRRIATARHAAAACGKIRGAAHIRPPRVACDPTETGGQHAADASMARLQKCEVGQRAEGRERACERVCARLRVKPHIEQVGQLCEVEQWPAQLVVTHQKDLQRSVHQPSAGRHPCRGQRARPISPISRRSTRVCVDLGMW